MVSPDPLNPGSELNQVAIAENSMNETPSLQQPLPERRNPWVTALMTALLLLGVGLGWRWWQSWQAADAGADVAAPQAQSVPVGLETVQVATVQEASEFVGSLESRSAVTLSPEIDGRIIEIYVKAGDRVAAGMPLVQLKPDQRQAEYASVLASINSARAIRASAASEVQALQADRAASIAELDLQNENFRRNSTLVREGALAEDRLDVVERDRRTAIADLNAINQRIQAARANLAESDAALNQAQANAAAASSELRDTTVFAPFAGTIGDVPAKLGQYVEAGEALTTVTQSQTLELDLSVPLEQRPDLQTGQRVELLDAQGKPLDVGQISFISPQVNAASQSVLIKASFDNSDRRLIDGQLVRARLIWSEGRGILVPTVAISRLGGQTFVFVAERQQPSQPGESPSGQSSAGQPSAGDQSGQPTLVARQQQVRLGNIQGNRYQVLEGLKPGQQIVVSGILNLSDGAPIAPES
jgi:multidrug efflux pump subunit AcrA (membrane-fusion protein)